MSKRHRLSILALGLVMVAGCSDSPTSPSDPVATDPPYTETFATTISSQGAASRTFVAHGPGTVSLALTSTTPAVLQLGLGIGIPTPSPTACSLTRAVTAVAGTAPQVQVTVDAGTYCVTVYDVGGIASTASFSLTMVHP